MQSTLFNSENETIFLAHTKENNFNSEASLNENYKHFNKQCQTVFDQLMNGVHLTSINAVKNYDIVHLARRILDLKENGVRISDTVIKDTNGSKSWYMSEEDCTYNNKFVR